MKSDPAPANMMGEQETEMSASRFHLTHFSSRKDKITIGSMAVLVAVGSIAFYCGLGMPSTDPAQLRRQVISRVPLGSRAEKIDSEMRRFGFAPDKNVREIFHYQGDTSDDGGIVTNANLVAYTLFKGGRLRVKYWDVAFALDQQGKTTNVYVLYNWDWRAMP